jgi:zeaxanthin glucosyltransferase
MSAEALTPLESRSPSERGTIVFFVSNFTSHVYSTAGLARRLRDLGYLVEYWGDNSIQRMVAAQGFPLYEVSPTWYCYDPILQEGWKEALRDFGGTLQRLRAAHERRGLLAASIADLERALRRELSRCTPDLVLLDPMLAAYAPLLRAHHVRCALLQDKPWPGADPLVPPPTSDLVPRDTLATKQLVALSWLWERSCLRMRDFGNAFLGSLGYYTCQQLLPAVLAHIGKPVSSVKATRRVEYDLYLDGLEEWVLGAPQADLPRSSPLPREVRYIGAWPDLRRKQAPVTIRRESEDSRVVYVAMGISMPSWRDDLALLRRVVEALRTIPNVKVVVSAGNVKAFSALRDLSKQVQIAPFLPQLACLQQADLAVTHGGANTYRECIATNTPMLVFARDYDQHGNAARVEHLGLGLRGNREWDSPDIIRGKAQQILENAAFPQRVRALNESLRASDPILLDCALRTIARSIAAAV